MPAWRLASLWLYPRSTTNGSEPCLPGVVVVGDLLYDMLARVEGSVAFGTDTFTEIHAAAGGSGANSAVWLASLGFETHFVGRVGTDVLGKALAAELKRSGVVPHLARDRSLLTGKVFVLVDGVEIG